MLHHVAHVHIRLPHLGEGHRQHRLDVLQREAVPLDTLEGLRPAHQGLDVFGVDLEDGRAVLDDAVEVGYLLVARRPVGVGLHGQIGVFLAGAFQPLDAFGVVFDGDCMMRYHYIITTSLGGGEGIRAANGKEEERGGTNEDQGLMPTGLK